MEINGERRDVYLCIATLRGLKDPAAYKSSLNLMYSDSILARARELMNGENRFFGQAVHGIDLLGCDMHQRLLDAYAKLHPKPKAFAD
jgi:ribosomal protein S12 methylthiotransferase accessory factor